MNSILQFEDRASSRRSKHEGESSNALCDRLSRTRDFSQRQLPTDQDYAVSTREYQTDQSSLKPAPAAAGPVLDKQQNNDNDKNNPTDVQELTGSLHIRAFCHAPAGLSGDCPRSSASKSRRAAQIPRFSSQSSPKSWAAHLVLPRGALARIQSSQTAWKLQRASLRR
jgi:hypothetical protein